MNKYHVTVYDTKSTLIEVEARTEDEAIALAGIQALEIPATNWTTADEPYDYDVELIESIWPEKTKLELMLEVFKSYGFECNLVTNGKQEAQGYLIHALVGKGEFDIEWSVYLNCGHVHYADGLTPENLLTAWKEVVTRFDPAVEAWEALSEWADGYAAAKNLRRVLTAYDAHAIGLRLVRDELELALRNMNAKEDVK